MKALATASVCATFIVGVLFLAPTSASTWTNASLNGDWNDAGNWGDGNDFTGGVGEVPALPAAPPAGGDIGAAVGAAPLNFNQTGARALYMIANNFVNIQGGDLTYWGDGLWGSNIGGAASGIGFATINHSAGDVTHLANPSAGFLIGHNVDATYRITGGTVNVDCTDCMLAVDFDSGPDGFDGDGGFGVPSNVSELNIGGDAVVTVNGNLHIGAQGTLNVVDNGLLIWRNRSVSDLDGEFDVLGVDTFPVISPPDPENGYPGGMINALVLQVGDDVHFVEIPEPSTPVLLLVAAAFATWPRRNVR